jgi:outer membrane receptor protein involved in Fe transport
LQDATRITNELRLTSTGDSRFQWMVGAFYENNKDGWVDSGEIPNLTNTIHWDYTLFRSCQLEADGFPVDCPTAPLNDIWYIDDYARDITQIAAFGEVDYNLTDNLKLTAGLRWFEYDRLVVNDQQWPPGLPVEGILLDGESAFVEEGTESDTALKFGLSYTLDDDKMVYALYSEGFRLGGSNNAKAVRINFVPQNYNPDSLSNYEAGIKSEWFDNRLQLNATAFYMVWEDIQLVIESDQIWWLTGQVNGGGGRNLGFEVDFDWHVTQDLRLTGSAYAGDAYYTDDYVTPEGILEMSKYTQMPDSAANKYNLAVDYTFRNVLGGDMFVRFDGYYAGAMFSSLARADDANPLSPDYIPGSKENVDSFSKYNFQIGYTSGEGDWNAILMVRNLTDARANSFTGTGTKEYADYWGHTGFGATNTLARPRTISLKLTKNF